MAETDTAAPTGDALDLSVAAHASVDTARAELRKLAERMRYRAECQITACGFWGNFQLLVGGAAAVSAAVAGASAFSKQSVVAGVFAVAASVLSATLATVKAGERAAAHERSANELNLLSESSFRLNRAERELRVGVGARHFAEPNDRRPRRDRPQGAVRQQTPVPARGDLPRPGPVVLRSSERGPAKAAPGQATLERAALARLT